MEERINQFSVGNSTREKVILDGRKMDKVTTTAYAPSNSASLNATYYFLRGIQGYEISVLVQSKDNGELKKEAKQILSTLKFLD